MTTKATALAAVKITAPTMTVKQMDTAIAAAIESSKSLQGQIQDVAVAIMLHAYKHGDYTRAQLLVDGLGEGVRRKALVEWFHKSGLDVSEKDGLFTGFKSKVMEKNWSELLATPWYKMKPENPFSGFDLDAELSRLIKRAEQAMKKNAELPSDAELPEGFKMSCDAEKLATLRSLAGITLQ
jgi:hypothetical protein